MLMKISTTEFLHRVAHNTALLTHAFKTGQSLMEIVPKCYTCDSVPGEANSWVLSRNFYDIGPSLFLGHLPMLTSCGIDAVGLKDNDFIGIEHKISWIRESKVEFGKNGGPQLHSDGDTAPTGITSAIRAKYSALSATNKDRKKIHTVLGIIDADSKSDLPIDFYQLAPDFIADLLDNTSKSSVSISLGRFKKHGIRPATVIDLEGWEAWIARIKLENKK